MRDKPEEAMPVATSLEDNLELLEVLIHNSPQPMLLGKEDGTILLVNQAICDLTGRTRENIFSKGRAGLLDTSDERLATALAQSNATGEFKGELFLLNQAQERIPVEVQSKTFCISGGRKLRSVYVRDLRPEKEAEQKIAQQQQDLEGRLNEYSLILEHSADMICSFLLDGTILHMNKACKTVLGYEPHEMIGHNYREFIHPDDIEETEKDTERVQVQLITTNFKNRYIHKNGDVVYLSWISSYSPEQGKNYCIGRDISDLRKEELLKQESEDRLQALLQHGGDIISLISAEGKFMYVSPNVHKVLGYKEEEYLSRNILELVHPEDKEEVARQLQEVLNGYQVQTKPFRYKVGNGDWHWLETTATNCLNVPSINGIVANSRDVTQRRLQEIMLEESEQRYKALFDYNPDSVYSLDREGNFTSVNDATVQMLQMPREEILKLGFRDLATPEALAQNETDFQKVLQGKPVTAETSLYAPGVGKMHYVFTEMPIIINGEVVGVHGIAKDITNTKEQQLLLEASAQRLDTILNSIKDAFFTLDKEWRFTYVNKEFEDILQVRKEELLGLDIREVYKSEVQQNFFNCYRQAMEEQKPVHFEEFSTTTNLWLDVSAFPSEEGLTVYFREINARKKAEAELKKLSLVASKTVNSVYITDGRGNIEWVNEGFTRITGYTLEEAIGQKPGDFLAAPNTDAAQLSTIRERLMADEPFVQEVQNISKAGEVYWSKLDVTPIFDEQNNGEKKFIVIETVITEQKKAEEERAQLTEELLRRNRHLEQFTYIVSHNLRSPVANIMGLTSLLNTAKNHTLQEGVVDRLNQTAQNLDYIIRDLNELLSMQAGVLTEREKFSLPEMVEQVLQVLPGESYGKIAVNLNGVDEIGAIKSYVSSILSNLLTNAVKYKSPDRALQLSITAELQQDQEILCLKVTDNGLGIDLEKQGKNLFGLYKRFHFHVTGRGLGLYLVKTQAEVLGGYVTVESTPGQGSTFIVYIRNSK